MKRATTGWPVLLIAAARGDLLAGELAARIVSCGLEVRSVPLRPGADARCEAHLSAAMAHVESPFVLGGFSLGARVAAQLCAPRHLREGRAPSPVGLLCFGYPFHTRGQPSSRAGLEAIRRVPLPARVIQGSRDSHGSAADVRAYALPDTISITWLQDGNHRFVPRLKSGVTRETLLAAATVAACAFVRSCGTRTTP